MSQLTCYPARMRRTSFAAMHCSLARSLEIIGDWWNPLILRDLYLGVTRFDDLVEDLGVSRNLLATRLDDLVAGGLVERRPYQTAPPRHDYVLSEAGRDLVPVLMALTNWGDRWVAPKGGPPVRFRHDGCGAEFSAVVACSACGEPITADDVTVLPGPGGKVAPGTAVVSRRIAARASKAAAPTAR